MDKVIRQSGGDNTVSDLGLLSFDSLLVQVAALTVLQPHHTNNSCLRDQMFNSGFELLPFTVIGVMGGLLGAFYVRAWEAMMPYRC